MSRIYKVRPNNITESFLRGDESWGPCNLCGGPTIDDQCAGDCCPGPDGTAKCIDCGHFSPMTGVLTVKLPGSRSDWPAKSCPCPQCNIKEADRCGACPLSRERGLKVCYRCGNNLEPDHGANECGAAVGGPCLAHQIKEAEE